METLVTWPEIRKTCDCVVHTRMRAHKAKRKQTQERLVVNLSEADLLKLGLIDGA